MTKKKILTLAMTLSMVAILAIGGTIAYFTDTDSDVNVMTTGQLDIEQTEVFTPDSPLYPSTDYAACADNVEKDVFVKNVGTVDAYLRTMFAMEDTADLCDQIKICSDYVEDLVCPSNDTDDWLQFKATIKNADGTTEETVYTITYLYYPEILKVGETTNRLLDHVTLNSTADNRWSEVAGAKWDLLVLSQAVQSAGFDSAEEAFKAETSFGLIDETSDGKVAGWFKPLIESKLGEGQTLVSVAAHKWDGSNWMTVNAD